VFSHNHPDRTGSAKRLANGRMPRISFADMILSSDDTSKPRFYFFIFLNVGKMALQLTSQEHWTHWSACSGLRPTLDDVNRSLWR
jgi:hypothetical protein